MSSAPDAELVATVEQVAPGGASRPLSTGALLGSLRALDRRLSWSRDGAMILPAHPYTAASARDLRAGRIERLDLDVYPTVARLAPGDRLRLTITTGDTALQPSPVQMARLAGGVYAVQRGGARGSTLTVPMAPASAFDTSPIDWGECKASC